MLSSRSELLLLILDQVGHVNALERLPIQSPYATKDPEREFISTGRIELWLSPRFTCSVQSLLFLLHPSFCCFARGETACPGGERPWEGPIPGERVECREDDDSGLMSFGWNIESSWPDPMRPWPKCQSRHGWFTLDLTNRIWPITSPQRVSRMWERDFVEKVKRWNPHAGLGISLFLLVVSSSLQSGFPNIIVSHGPSHTPWNVAAC